MKILQGMFAIGLGLVAAALVSAIAGQNADGKQFACMALVGGVLVGIAWPPVVAAILRESRKDN